MIDSASKRMSVGRCVSDRGAPRVLTCSLRAISTDARNEGVKRAAHTAARKQFTFSRMPTDQHRERDLKPAAVNGTQWNSDANGDVSRALGRRYTRLAAGSSAATTTANADHRPASGAVQVGVPQRPSARACGHTVNGTHYRSTAQGDLPEQGSPRAGTRARLVCSLLAWVGLPAGGALWQSGNDELLGRRAPPVRPSTEPDWLKIDERIGTISGVPNRPGKVAG
jgi:hypothetical protein